MPGFSYTSIHRPSNACLTLPLVVGAERLHRLDNLVEDFGVLVLPIEVDERHELVVGVVGLEAEHPLAQPVIAPQRLGAGLRGRHQILDDRRRNVVAVKRRLERALELARLRDEPVALQHAVVDGGVRVGIGRERLVKRVKRGGAIGLMAIGLQQARCTGRRSASPACRRAA